MLKSKQGKEKYLDYRTVRSQLSEVDFKEVSENFIPMQVPDSDGLTAPSYYGIDKRGRIYMYKKNFISHYTIPEYRLLGRYINLYRELLGLTPEQQRPKLEELMLFNFNHPLYDKMVEEKKTLKEKQCVIFTYNGIPTYEYNKRDSTLSRDAVHVDNLSYYISDAHTVLCNTRQKVRKLKTPK